MATTIRIWDADTFERKTSERRYNTYTVVTEKRGDESWEIDQLVNLTLYVDEETGIVTTDVAAYERSLK